MNHPDPEVLTQLALSDPLAIDADTLVHIADCDQCSAEVAVLQRVVAATDSIRDDPRLGEVTSPPDRVWDLIALSAGTATGDQRTAGIGAAASLPAQTEPSADWLFEDHDRRDSSSDPLEQSAPTRSAERPSRRRTIAQVMVAAAVGVIAGALVTWGITQNDDADPGSGGGDTTFTTSDLVGIDGHTTSGVASFTETPSGGEVTIELKPEDVGEGFIQAWLLDEDTGGMVALGVVDANSGTFAVPKDLDLSAFNQIDISLEPYDGNPEHSAVSLARGPLP